MKKPLSKEALRSMRESSYQITSLMILIDQFYAEQKAIDRLWLLEWLEHEPNKSVQDRLANILIESVSYPPLLPKDLAVELAMMDLPY